MSSLSVAVLLTLAICANAQFNYRCRGTPERWMGDAFIVDYDTHFVRFSEIYYNRLTEAVYERVYERNGENSRPTLVEEWYDYRTETKTNRTFGGECRSYTISRPFRPFGVPSDARYEGRSTFGVILGVDAFSGEFGDEDEGIGRYYNYWAPISPTSDAICVPVIESYIREGPSTPYPDRLNIHITYTNFTTIFENPPEPCTPVNIRGKGIL